MKPGFKFSRLATAALLLGCSYWCVVQECSAVKSTSTFTTNHFVGVFGVFSTILAGSQYASALPPALFQKRLGSPMPQLGGPISLDDDEDSDEEEEELMDDSGQPRVEPHITPLNRDQCLAKLLCGMSVPVTGGSSKRNYYSEYANIVSRYFEAFPVDEELQSKESIETYDDYSNEDDGKPKRTNSRRKPLNSSRVEATAPTLQLFDLALVDVAKPEDAAGAKNRTAKAAFEKVSTGNRIARARRIVENLGQKLQTVRQCQSIEGCPFTFKQLREKLKKKEAQRISSNVPLPPGPGPVWPVGSKRKEEPMPAQFQPRPYVKPQSRPRPLPPNRPKPESSELFSHEDPVFPYKDTHKGDDEIEELFGPAPVSKKPLKFHQGVDEDYNYEYNPSKPWRPGSNGGNSYAPRPWNSRPRPQSKPFSNNNEGSNNNNNNNRAPQRPRPRPGSSQSNSQKRYPLQNQNQQQQRRPSLPPSQQPKPKKPLSSAPTVTTTTTRSPFPKKKISYFNSPYNKPANNNGDDDEGLEDINKVAPVVLIGNADAGESEPNVKKEIEDAAESASDAAAGKKEKDDDENYSDEYDDDYDDDYEDDEDALDDEEEEDDYSEEEEDDKESKGKKKKQKGKKKNETKKKKKKKVTKAKDEEDEEEDEDRDIVETPATKSKSDTATPKKKAGSSSFVDDENEGVDDIWTKLNFATTGANYKVPEKLKKKEKTKDGASATAAAATEEDEADDGDDEEEDDEEVVEVGKPKIKVSSSSASNEDEADDEVDDENASKRKRSKPKAKSKAKAEKPEKEEQNDETEADIGSPPAADESKKKQGDSGSKKTKKTKTKGSKKKPVKKGSSEEEDSNEAARRKQFMMEIGGRPLVPKPDHDQNNAHKTSSLISNRFKFQFINPYGPAPPSDTNLPGAYTPLRTSYGANSAPSSSSSSSLGNAAASAVSSLPFKFKINPGPLGSFAGGGGMGPLGGAFSGFGSGSSPSASVELPDPHHPPPPSGYLPPPQQQPLQPQQRQEHFGLPSSQQSMNPGGISSGIGGLSGSGLFKLNPLPALSNLFKRPAPGFDPMNGPEGHGPPPVAAFMHRPVGPESSHYMRSDRTSPASGSSNPTTKKASKGSKGSSKDKKRKL